MSKQILFHPRPNTLISAHYNPLAILQLPRAAHSEFK